MPGVGAAISLCASLACSSPAAAPQQTAVQSDTVTVAVDSVWREGDKIAVAYHVSLGTQWTGNLFSFLVQPGVPLQAIATDGPDHWIDQKSTYDGRDAIEWTALAAEDRPTTGQALGGFVLRTRAILGSVPFMAMPYEPPVLTSEDQLGDTLHIKPFWTRGRSGTVLGPAAPLPVNATDRAAQLTTDLTGWCSDDTSVPRGICGSLSNKATDVRTAAGSSDQGQLTQAVRVFRSELDAQRGRHVSEMVYWRLVADLLMVAQ